MSEYDPTDLADEQSRNAQVKASAEQEARWEIEDLAWLMRAKAGRRVMWRLLMNAGVYRLSFNGDALQSAFNEGQRNGGLRLLAVIQQHCSEGYALMVQERSNVRS